VSSRIINLTDTLSQQGKLCLGSEAAQDSCFEIEEILRTHNGGVHAKFALRLNGNDSLGDDTLSVMLILILLRSTNYQSLLNPAWKAEALNKVLSSRYILPLLTAISSKVSIKARCELHFNQARPISLTVVLDSMLSSAGSLCEREHTILQIPLSLTSIALSTLLVVHGHFFTASYISWSCRHPVALFVYHFGLQHLLEQLKDSRQIFVENNIHYQRVLDILLELTVVPQQIR